MQLCLDIVFGFVMAVFIFAVPLLPHKENTVYTFNKFTKTKINTDDKLNSSHNWIYSSWESSTASILCRFIQNHLFDL